MGVGRSNWKCGITKLKSLENDLESVLEVKTLFVLVCSFKVCNNKRTESSFKGTIGTFLFNAKKNADYCPQPSFCSFVRAEFETSVSVPHSSFRAHRKHKYNILTKGGGSGVMWPASSIRYELFTALMSKSCL